MSLAPLISVIMTVRDGASFIAQAMNSVRAQTLEDWELVIWDDGSADGTLAIVKALAVDEPRIRWFAGATSGRRQALVEAHARARGRYLAWLDADDWLAPEALAKAHAVLSASGSDMVYTDHTVTDPDGAPRGLGRRTRIPYSAHRLLLDFMTFHLRVFSREIFERVGGIAPDREIAIDYDLCLRISEQGRITQLGEPLYFYREHAEQMSTRRRTEQMEASAAAIRAAIVRRGLDLELVVDTQRGRFRLVPRTTVPRRVGWLRVAAATAVPRLRRKTRVTASAIGYWPARDESAYRRQLYAAVQARGVPVRPLGRDLARLVRAVWTGRAGDVLHIHGIGPLLAAPAEGSVLAACLIFLKTLDHARARGMGVVSMAAGPRSAHPRHPSIERWCLRELAYRCDKVVTHWPGEPAAAGPATSYFPHPNIGDGYPRVTRDFARASLGLPPRTSPTHLYLGATPARVRDGDLVLDGDVDAYPPRHVAAYFAASDVAVLPSVTPAALALAMAMGKPIVAPAMPELNEVDGFFCEAGDIESGLSRAHAARDEWARMGQANLERIRAQRWDAIVDAVISP